ALLEHLAEIALHFLGHFGIHTSLSDELIYINLPGVRMRRNGLIEGGLRKAGLIRFVVTVFPVTENIDEYVVMELLPVLHGHLNGMNQRFHIVPVHMKNRRKRHFRDVRTIGAGTAVAEIGGKANLV